VAGVFDALIATLRDTCLEGDLADLLWSIVNLFHRTAALIQNRHDCTRFARRR